MFRSCLPSTPKRSLRQRLPLLKPRVLGGSLVIAAAAIGAVAAGRGLAFVPQKAIEGPLTLANFVKGTTIASIAASVPPWRWWTPTCMCAPLAGHRFPTRS
jgi:DNA-binding transcriptional LysR family regulator